MVDGSAIGDDALGDRMKKIEAAWTEARFVNDPSQPIYARIDGRSFSRFTLGMDRPFDERMTLAMIDTTVRLVKDTHACIGYTQSDEISLVWLPGGDMSELFFGGKVQKTVSVIASLAAAAFNRAILCRFGNDTDRANILADRLPHFDTRVIQLPSRADATNMILWRCNDASRNAISMAARAVFPHSALHGRGSSEMLRMLAAKGVVFDDYHESFRHGAFVRRRVFDRAYAETELARIPERHRPEPGTLVTRSDVTRLAIPVAFRFIQNREAVIFDDADPILPQPLRSAA